MALLELIDITKRFGPTLALDHVNLNLRQGEVHAILGENGAGKSTLMNIITGELAPDSGHMRIDGQPYAPSSPAVARQTGVALIHQELSLFPHLTVAENILIGQEQTRFGWLDRRGNNRRALGVLESFAHRDISPEAKVGDLPIAARQVVEICRAIAASARIILMDEPTSSLQKQDADRLFELIDTLRSDGISIVFISHFLEEVRQVADTYSVLRDGRNAGSGDLLSVSDADLIAMMVGRSVTDFFPEREFRAGEVILEVTNLAAPPSVIDASFQMRRGEILGIAGLMGSGRTEMVRALFGLSPASGTVRIGSQSSTRARQPVAARIASGLGYLSEDRQGEGLATGLSIADNVTMTRLDAFSRLGWLDGIAQREQTSVLVKQLSIKAGSPSQRVATLSGGNQQKVALARLVHQDVDILLLDEPTRGIDVGSKAQIYQLMARLAAEGKAILMVSSYLPELLGMCDSLAVMSRGRLSRTRPTSEWTAEAILQAAIGREEDNE